MPFRFDAGYVVFALPLAESGENLNMVFDSGCQTTVFRPDVAEGKSEGSPVRLRLGERVLAIEDYQLHSQDGISRKVGRDIHGVIGNDLLHRFQVKLDFEHRRLSVIDSPERIPVTKGETIELEVNSLVSSLFLAVQIRGAPPIEGRFVIDTGAPVTLVLSSHAAENAGIDPATLSGKSREFKTRADVQTAMEIEADSIKIGSTRLDDIPIYVSTSKRGLFAVTRYAGILGTQLLRQFNVIFDYRHKLIRLERIVVQDAKETHAQQIRGCSRPVFFVLSRQDGGLSRQ